MFLVEALALDGKAKIFSANVMMVHFNSRCHIGSGVERGGAGGGGASAPGPGPVVGARAKLDFLFSFDRKSVGDPGF